MCTSVQMVSFYLTKLLPAAGQSVPAVLNPKGISPKQKNICLHINQHLYTLSNTKPLATQNLAANKLILSVGDSEKIKTQLQESTFYLFKPDNQIPDSN